MSRDSQKTSILDGNKYIAFLFSVLAATVCFVSYTIIHNGISNFESATQYSIIVKIAHLLLAIFFMGLIGFILCAMVTALPFFVAFALAVKFQIKNSWYFIIGGVIAGCCVAPLFAYIPYLGFDQDAGVSPSFTQNLYVALPLFGICGFFAGMAAVRTLLYTGRYSKMKATSQSGM